MADLNAFVFTGRLTQDASSRVLASGKKVLTANVAVNTGYGDYKKTLFIKMQMWGDRGDKLLPYLKKGQLVGGQGEMSRSEWTDNSGMNHVDFVVDVMNIQLLGSKTAADAPKQGASESHPVEDDITF